MNKIAASVKRVWITGASSGIGRATALEFHKKGYQLIISGRNLQALEQLAAETKATVIAFDVSDRNANLAAAEKIQKSGGVDIIVLNAGNCEYIDIKNFDSSAFERMIKTNFLSMVYGVEASLPLLRTSHYPHLVGVSSTAAYLGLPRAEAYGASKAAIRNFFESLRLDLLPEKIPVSIVCPGFVKTPLTDKNDFAMPNLISAEQAAQYIVNGIEKKRQEIYFPKLFAYCMKLISMLPSPLYTFIVYKITHRS